MTKIALAQMQVKSGQPNLNFKKILKFVDEAKKNSADILIFPRHAISGAMIGRVLHQSAFINDCENYAKEIFQAGGNLKILFDNDIDETLNFRVVSESTPFAIDNEKIRHALLSKEARIENRPIIYVNCIGVQNKSKTIYTFDGNSKVYNSKGEVVIQAGAFEETLIFVNLEEIDKMPSLAEHEESEIAAIYKALHYGVKNFLEQIGMKKIVIGISGGIDSAVDAALYTKILGAENVLLVNMPSKFNSSTTKNLSEQLAKNLGCNYMIVPIQESVDRTVEQIESTPMNFLTDNSNHQITISSFVKENIQARDRSGRVLATLAAAFGGGFTCNANKAESTVGYATLYGDCAGVVSALADLWKHQVYALAHYLNDEIYKREVIPQGIIDIVPSAELSNAQNVDEGKGDPLKYPYHDYLFKAFVENFEHSAPEDVLKSYAAGTLEQTIGCEAGLVEKYFPTPKDFIADLERWWNLFTGFAVAKRIQAPPVIAVTSHAFGSFQESQNAPYYTRAYETLKKELLDK